VPALAAALARLMTDAALRARMGAAARARAEREFGIDRMLDAMERVFARVAAGSPPAGGPR
jgi:glycosyltransferase involved in cell wall biosynthesis